MAPRLSRYMNGFASALYADELNANGQVCNTYNDLRAFVAEPGMAVYCQGAASIGDGGQGWFAWTVAPAVDDNANIIVSTRAFPPAYWSRLALEGQGVSFNIADGALTAPCLVHVESNFKVQYANAATGLSANGFLRASVLNGVLTPVYTVGLLTGLAGLTGGDVFLDPANPGGVTSTPPSTGGQYVQRVGVAMSPTSIAFGPNQMNGPL